MFRYKPGTGTVMADQSIGTRREGYAMATRDRRQQQYRGHGVAPADPNLHPGPVPHEGMPPHVVPTPEPESFTVKVFFQKPKISFALPLLVKLMAYFDK